jgi:hypothetical protein
MHSDLSEIISSIDELASRGRISRNRAFAAWYSINFFDVDEDEALEGAAADGGNDQGIDSVFADEASQEIIAIQAACPDNFDKRTPKSKWDAAIASAAFLKRPENLAKAGRPDLADAIQQIRETYPDYMLAIGLISLGAGSTEISSLLKAHQEGKSKEKISYFFSPQAEVYCEIQGASKLRGGLF